MWMLTEYRSTQTVRPLEYYDDENVAEYQSDASTKKLGAELKLHLALI
jgi:hypothetical protein